MYMGTPLWPIAEDLHKQLGSHATLLATRSGGNPFDESISTIFWEVAERLTDYPLPPACVAATIELRGESDVDDTTASEDAQNLYRFLQRRGYIAGNPGPLPEAQSNPTSLEGVDMVRAPSSGIVTFLREPGEFVRKQEKVAIIVDPLSTHGPNARVAVVANTTGIMFARRADRMTSPGQVLCKIAGVNPIADRDTDHLLDD
jgi:predicted deacylase